MRGLLGPEAWLYYISPFDGDRRLYRCGDRVAKIQRRWNRPLGHRQELSTESEAMRRLDLRGDIKRDPRYSNDGEWEILSYRFVSGVPFRRVWQRRWLGARLALIWEALAAAGRLSAAGIGHGDLVANNMVVGDGGRVHLVDFGDARLMSPVRALTWTLSRAILGRHGIVVRSVRSGVLRVAPGLQNAYRGLKLQRVKPFSIAATDDPDLGGLVDAWRRFARWNTDANEWVAYSSLSVDGVNFPGWRPWLLRWTQLNEFVSFQGKRVLDLGTSSGLLCSFALLAGAKEAHGVDSDPLSIEGAQEVSKALGVSATFELLDVDSSTDWEDRLRGADLVAALSVMEWVTDRSRLLRFIGEHAEVLYEGHDPVDVELERLHSAGFRFVQIVAVDDRARPLFYGRKSSASAK